MNELEILCKLLGRFNFERDGKKEDWLEIFLECNIKAICENLFPGETVYFAADQRLHVDIATKLHPALDYVPVISGIPHFGDTYLESVSCHCFLLRNLEMSPQSASMLKNCSLTSVLMAWTFIGYAMRYALQVRYGEKVTMIPFGVLTDYGIASLVARQAQSACLSSSALAKLTDEQMLTYMDRNALACLVGYPTPTEQDRIEFVCERLRIGIRP